MRLRSFGCSFIYGSELSDRNNTWPALIADRLGFAHENHGIQGAGNLQIMECILTHANKDDACIVNWTWIDRFDTVMIKGQEWHTEQWYTLLPSDTDRLAEFYYRNLHSQYRDMLTNLVYANTAMTYLRDIGCRFIMTHMDGLIFETFNDDWHDRRAVSYLQQQIRPHMKDFNGKTFLEWSRQNNFAESALWHPLDEAHSQAAELMLPVIESILRRA